MGLILDCFTFLGKSEEYFFQDRDKRFNYIQYYRVCLSLSLSLCFCIRSLYMGDLSLFIALLLQSLPSTCCSNPKGRSCNPWNPTSLIRNDLLLMYRGLFPSLLCALSENKTVRGYGLQSRQYLHNQGGVITNGIKAMP